MPNPHFFNSKVLMEIMPLGLGPKGPFAHQHIFYEDGTCGVYGCLAVGKPTFGVRQKTVWERLMCEDD